MENFMRWPNVNDGDVIGLIFSSAAYFATSYWCHSYERFTYEMMNLPELSFGAAEIAGNAVAQSAGIVGFFSGKVEPVKDLIKASLCPDGVTDINVTGVVSESSSWELVKPVNVAVAFFFRHHDELLRSCTRTAVPFNLVNEGNSFTISDPLDLDEIPLQTVAERIQLESMGLWRAFLAWSRSYFVIGIKHQEQMLLPGTEVSCLGKLVVRNGVSYLERDDYFPYTMGIQTKQETIQNMIENRILGRIFQFSFGVLAVYFIYRLWNYRKPAISMKTNRIQAMFDQRKICATNATVDTNNENLKDEVKCTSCSRLANTLVLPCGHLYVCIFCSKKVKICGLCGMEVEFCSPVMYST